MTEKLAAVQKQMAEGIAGALNVKPTPLWRVATVEDLITDNGTVDIAKVHAAVREVQDRLGLPVGLRVDREGYAPEPGKPSGVAAWNSVFEGRR